MAFDKSEFRKAMRVRLGTVSILPSIIQWENRSFKIPSVKTVSLWVREKLFILTERRTSQGYLEATGELRYDVFLPAGGGTKDAEDLTMAIAEVFEAGDSVVATGFGVHLERTERKNMITPRKDSEYREWSFLPVVIRWRVFTSTTA